MEAVVGQITIVWVLVWFRERTALFALEILVLWSGAKSQGKMREGTMREIMRFSILAKWCQLNYLRVK